MSLKPQSVFLSSLEKTPRDEKEYRKQIPGFQFQNRICRAEYEGSTVVFDPLGGVWVGCVSVTLSLLSAALVSLEPIRSSPDPSFLIC